MKWYTANAGDQGLIVDEETGRNVAVSYDKKDAELIASSPDLLEACKGMLSILEQIDFTKIPIDYDLCAWRDWELAINNAEGI